MAMFNILLTVHSTYLHFSDEPCQLSTQ